MQPGNAFSVVTLVLTSQDFCIAVVRTVDTCSTEDEDPVFVARVWSAAKAREKVINILGAISTKKLYSHIAVNMDMMPDIPCVFEYTSRTDFLRAWGQSSTQGPWRASNGKGP
jgi:hypothetical protein